MSEVGKTDSLLLGAHVSIAGGIEKAIARGEEVGCTAIQVFTRNASRWQAKPLTRESISKFRTAFEQSSIDYVASHDSYLINLASPDDQLRAKSVDAFVDEMQRCQQLGIGDLVMHPGAIWGRELRAGYRPWLTVFMTSCDRPLTVSGSYWKILLDRGLVSVLSLKNWQKLYVWFLTGTLVFVSIRATPMLPGTT